METVVSWQKSERYVGFIAEVDGGISSKLDQSKAGISRTMSSDIL